MAVRKWRVIMVRNDGDHPHRYGGGKSGRDQGMPLVSEQEAREIADRIDADIVANRADPDSTADVYSHCEVEEFDYIPPPPSRILLFANPPQFKQLIELRRMDKRRVAA